MTDLTTQIDVIRHGEPDGGRRYRGYGVNSLDFGNALAEKLGIPIIVNDDMKEIGFGTWEGLTPEEIIAADSEALNRFYQDPINNRPEGAEPLETFSERVWTAYEKIASEHAGKHVLIVAHAGVARAIVANVLEMPLDDVYSRLKIEYAAIVSTLIEGNTPAKMVVKA